MKRPLISLVSLGLLTSVAAAQPDPNTPPAPVPPADGGTPPAAVEPVPPPPPVDTVKTAGNPPTDGPAEKKDKDKKTDDTPKKLAIGKEGQGRWNPGMLAQGWFLLDRSGGKTTTSTFRLRRAEISAKGEILPKKVGFQVMFDPAKVREPVNSTVTDSAGNTVVVKVPAASLAVLQDFYITGMSEYVEASIGQFKIPVSWEGYNSSAKLYFPERSTVAQQFGDKRDLGIRLAKTFKKWAYSAGVFNGQGANNLDANVQKDVALRLEAYPVEGLTLAAVTYDSIGIRNRAGTKDRWEADARYEKDGILVQAEYIKARDVVKDNAGHVNAQGFYALAGYTIKDPSLHGELQPVVRVGYLDLDTDHDLDPTMGGQDELMDYSVGLNWYLKGHEMKMQAAYQRFQYDTKTPNNEIIVAGQVWY